MAKLKAVQGKSVGLGATAALPMPKAKTDTVYVAGHKGVKAPGKHGGGITNRTGKGWTNKSGTGWRA